MSRVHVVADTVAKALEELLAIYPALRPHLIDRRGQLRRHILVFVDKLQAPRSDLEQLPVDPEAVIHLRFMPIPG